MNSEKIAAKIQFELAVEAVEQMGIEMMLLELYGDQPRHVTTNWFYGPWAPKGVE